MKKCFIVNLKQYQSPAKLPTITTLQPNHSIKIILFIINSFSLSREF